MKTTPRTKSLLRWLTAAFFAVAGSLHFVNPGFYLSIMPPALPCPLALVYISGAFEILGGIGLLVPATRTFSVYGLILLLIAIFPANIYAFTQHLQSDGLSFPTILLALRLPLQIGFIAAVKWLQKN